MLIDIFTRGGARLPGIFLGAPEAEAEANENSRVPLAEVYEDYHNLAEQISGEKFIIIGRKGSGKSAFAEYVTLKSREVANVFSKFVKKSDYRLEEVVQASSSANIVLDTSSFFKWIIYTHMIKLLLLSEAAKSAPKFGLLDLFLKKNSGYINIDEYAIKERIRKDGFEVNIEPLKRFFRTALSRDLEIRQERAPYFRLIPHLEEVIKHIFGSSIELENKNSYILFFDDLDIGYVAGSKSSRDYLVDLIRVAKAVNADVFRGSGAKVVILLRDDIENDLSNFPDTAKMFASYAARISWFQDGFMSQIESENMLHLKAFINRRISYAFTKSGAPFVQSDPWTSMVSLRDDGYKPKTSFRRIVDLTLFRPRDILLFFLPLQDQSISIPIDDKAFTSMRKAYSGELAREIKNEFSAIYTEEEISQIFKCLKEISQSRTCSYRDALGVVSKNMSRERDASQVLDYLYDRSVIGVKDKHGHLTFKMRVSPKSGGQTISVDESVVVQYGLMDHIKSTR